MTAVTPVNPGVDTITAQKATVISDLVAGEALRQCVACVIEADGQVAETLAAAANAAAAIHGITPRAAAAGEPVTLLGVGTRFQYDGDGGLTPGAAYFVGATGGIDDATALGDVTGAFVAVSATDLVLIKVTPVGG